MDYIKKIVITGGSGFIGSHLVKISLKNSYKVLNLDKLNYCSNYQLFNNKNYSFKKIDIADENKVFKIIKKFNPDAIINCAAETHVDKSILAPNIFLDSNIISTLSLLNFLRKSKKKIKFIHLSTDEVFGSILGNKKFNLKSKYDPKSPYSASKAAADFFIRSYGNTYNIKFIIIHCTNNYGPYQYPEKLIPLTILKCLQKKKIPIYGKGINVREWIHVEDYCNAVFKILNKNDPKNTYLVGSGYEKKNIDIVNYICNWFSNNYDKSFNYNKLKLFVTDRKGHDKRYAIDSTQTRKNLNWKPKFNFQDGLNNTINFYIKNFRNLKKIFPYEKKNNFIW